MIRYATSLLTAALLTLLVNHSTVAKDLDANCPVRSNYDLTVRDTALLFERTSAPPQRIEMRSGGLAVNGAAVPLNAADRSRITSIEQTVRMLVPMIKTTAQRAVDLAAAAVREEAASASPKYAANPKLNAQLDARARELKARIAGSFSSKDWRGAAFNGYIANILGDVLPLIAGDLAQDALQATLQGNLTQAAALTERAAALRPSLDKRMHAKLEVLQPDFDNLCPHIRKLDALESAISTPLPGGARMDLIQVAPPPK